MLAAAQHAFALLLLASRAVASRSSQLLARTWKVIAAHLLVLLAKRMATQTAIELARRGIRRALQSRLALECYRAAGVRSLISCRRLHACSRLLDLSWLKM